MNFRNIIFYVSLFFIFILGIYVIYFIRSDSYKCMNNTPVYMIDLLQKANDAKVICTCSVLKSTNQMSVLLDENGFHLLNENTSEQNLRINFSGLNRNN